MCGVDSTDDSFEMLEMLIWRSRKGIDLNKLKLQGTYV